MTLHRFLSDEWMEAARAIRSKYQDDAPEVEHAVKINQVITEVPFGDGSILAFLDTSHGTIQLELGEVDEPDAVIVLDYATAQALFVQRDPAVFMQAMMAGKVKVQGDMMKLLALQASLPDPALAARIDDEIQAITEPPQVSDPEASDPEAGDVIATDDQSAGE